MHGWILKKYVVSMWVQILPGGGILYKIQSLCIKVYSTILKFVDM